MAVVIQANDLLDDKAKCRLSTPGSSSTRESVYKSLQDTLAYFSAEALTPIKSEGAKATVYADPMVCENPHTFYLLLKVLQHLASAPEDTKVDSSGAKAQLIRILTMPQGIQFCQKDLQIDLLRRNIMLQHGSGHNWFLLLAMMTKKLSDGDANWATIETSIHAAYANASQSSAVPKIVTEVDARTTGTLPEKWWTTIETEHDTSSGIGLLVKLKNQLETLSADEGYSKKDRGLTLGLLKLATWYPSCPASQLPGMHYGEGSIFNLSDVTSRRSYHSLSPTPCKQSLLLH